MGHHLRCISAFINLNHWVGHQKKTALFLLHWKLNASCFAQIPRHFIQNLTMCINCNCNSRVPPERSKVKRQCTAASKLAPAIKSLRDIQNEMQSICRIWQTEYQKKGIMMVGRSNGVMLQLVSLLTGDYSLNASLVVCNDGRRWQIEDSCPCECLFVIEMSQNINQIHL